MDIALIALLGTFFGGAGMKVIEHFLNKKGKAEDLATQMRKELRDDLATLRTELKEEARESDEWKGKYWELKTELLINNHKTNKAIEVIDEEHPDKNLGSELKGLEYPGK